MYTVSEVLIGTSGYDYPEWKGIFYPDTLPRKNFLSYYATQFNALEINNTFYNMPTEERLLNFFHKSEGKLQFSIKANRLLTHEISMDWKNRAEDFRKAARALQDKDVLASVLFQFPQSFHYTKENRFYLNDLIREFTGFPVVIEFRHIEWIKDSVIRGLEERNVSMAFCDMSNLKVLPDGITNHTPFVGNIAYIRLHGRNEDAWYSDDSATARYTYDYSDKELMQFCPVIDNASKSHKKIQIFFNNHPNGSGAKNGKRLRELLNEKSVFFDNFPL